MKKRLVGWTLLVVALAAMCFVVLTSAKAPQEQSVRRPDGSTVTLIAVTYGTNHSMVVGGSFQRGLYKVLPGKLKGLCGAVMMRNTVPAAQANVPVFWFHDSRDPAVRPFGMRPFQNLSFRVMDEYGCEHVPVGYKAANIFRKESYYQFDLHDPHCKIVGLCLYDSPEQTNELGRFLVPGAVLKSYTKAPKPSAPQRDGDMTFQLTSLVILPAEPPRFPGIFTSRGMSNVNEFLRATFRITKNGKPASNWVPSSLQITNAKGKRIQVWSTYGRAYQDGDDAFDFRAALDPADGPYKIRAEFVHHSGFASNEMVTFTNVPFPANSEVPSLTNMVAEALSHRVTLEKFKGSFTDRPEVVGFNSNQPFIVASIDPDDSSTHLQLISAMDEGHRDLQHLGMETMGQGKSAYGFAPDTRAKTVTLTFAVHQSRYAEFEMMPMVAATNAMVKQ